MEKQEDGSNSNKTHVVILPFPAQGHINPMLQFSKRLAAKGGLRVTLLTTISNIKSLRSQPNNKVRIEPITNNLDEGPIEAFVDRFKAVVSQTLSDHIAKLGATGYPVSCLVYDSALPWALDIAKQLGLTGASFFTQACAVSAIYCNVQRGQLSLPIEGATVSVPGLPLLGVHDLPSFVYDIGSYPSLLDLVLNRFSNVDKADWILFNTFDGLEEEVVKWMASQWRIKTIGPTIPSMYLDKRLEGDKDYGLNLFELNAEACMKWLDTKKVGSVVYISFGSLANLKEEQMEEVAWTLMKSSNYFLWVVRDSEQSKLPGNFMAETTENGLVVNWCPQLEVLAHQAVGCFMTHCGWNSTLEALSSGVPMVAMPQWTDQTTNAKFIVDIWQAGVRAKVDEKGVVKREEIEMCLKEVLEGEKGKEIKRNAMRWKELAKEAADEGGSSDKNIEEFVSELLCT